MDILPQCVDSVVISLLADYEEKKRFFDSCYASREYCIAASRLFGEMLCIREQVIRANQTHNRTYPVPELPTQLT